MKSIGLSIRGRFERARGGESAVKRVMFNQPLDMDRSKRWHQF